jgi:hypothetical protein
MDCKQAQALVPRYIRQDMEGAELEEFLEHVKHCSDCYEELEIYYTIDAALKELDGDGSNTQTLKTSMEQALHGSERKLRSRRCFLVGYYALNTVVFWIVAAVLVLQIRRFMGIF